MMRSRQGREVLTLVQWRDRGLGEIREREKTEETLLSKTDLGARSRNTTQSLSLGIKRNASCITLPGKGGGGRLTPSELQTGPG